VYSQFRLEHHAVCFARFEMIRGLDCLKQQIYGNLANAMRRLNDHRQPGTEKLRPIEIVKATNAHVLGAGETELLEGAH
jgi:hypothetical protein